MGRTATDVVGNAVATSIITKWEGLLEEHGSESIEHPHTPANSVYGGARGLDLDADIMTDEGSRTG